MQTPTFTGFKKRKTDYNCSNVAVEMLPNITQSHHSTSPISSEECERFQNIHPLLDWYKHDLRTGRLSYDDFSELMNPDNDIELINLLAQIGIIDDSKQCLMCGGYMKKHKEGAHWFWLCRKRVDGVKCQILKEKEHTHWYFARRQQIIDSAYSPDSMAFCPPSV